MPGHSDVLNFSLIDLNRYAEDLNGLCQISWLNMKLVMVIFQGCWKFDGKNHLCYLWHVNFHYVC